MKSLRSVACCCLVTTLSVSAMAQQPVPAPGAPAAAKQAPKVDPMQRAFVDADGHRPSAIAAAADQLRKADAAGRARFVETLQAISAAAPKFEAVPAPAAGERAPASETKPGETKPGETKPVETKPVEAKPVEAKPVEAKPVEFGDPTKQLMVSVVMGSADASKAALASLAADTESGPAALARLNQRGNAILEQCLTAIIRKKMEIGALFAGQYDELQTFQPLASAVLLRWAQEPPKGAADPGTFRSSCVRAVRDIVPADQATDALRATLREVVAKTQRQGDTFLHAACALHQYGDPSAFDRIKAQFEKQLEAESPEAKTNANKILAELFYQLRDYEKAADYYKTCVSLSEQQSTASEALPTLVYNTACSLSLAKKIDEGFEYLEKALKLRGRSLSKAMIDADHDMDNLREDPRFAKLMEQYLSKANPHGK